MTTIILLENTPRGNKRRSKSKVILRIEEQSAVVSDYYLFQVHRITKVGRGSILRNIPNLPPPHIVFL